MATEPVDLDASRLETYRLCPMKYKNRYVYGLSEPKGLNARFSTHLIHDPITEWYLKGRDWVPTPEEWQAKFDSIAVTPEEQAIKANARYNVEAAQRCFNFYRERFGADHERFEFLGIENYLLDKENFKPLAFGSKPDVRARERNTGNLFTFELKFSEWDFILEASTMNPQFLGQVNNTKGRGVIVTLIQPIGTTWKNFNAVREEIVPTQAELEKWRKDIQFSMDNVQRSYATDVWPKHTPHACTSYSGCFFVGLCVAGHPKEMLERMPKADDPLGYLGGGQ